MRDEDTLPAGLMHVSQRGKGRALYVTFTLKMLHTKRHTSNKLPDDTALSKCNLKVDNPSGALQKRTINKRMKK